MLLISDSQGQVACKAIASTAYYKENANTFQPPASMIIVDHNNAHLLRIVLSYARVRILSGDLRLLGRFSDRS